MSNTLGSRDLQPYAYLPDNILHTTAPVIIANDYDGMTGKTGSLPNEGSAVEGAMGLLLATAGIPRFNIASSVILSAWRKTEAVAGSFDSLGTVRDQLPPEDYDAFRSEYLANKAGVALMYPDADDYFVRLNTPPAIPNFTLTYGKQDWQKLKTRTAGVPGHVEITSQREKGPVIDSMRGADGTYDFVALNAAHEIVALVHGESMTLVDDKPSSFNRLPVGCRGIYLQRSGETRKASQVGTVDPDQVDTIHDLDGITVTDEMRPSYDAETAGRMLSVVTFVPVASYALRFAT